MIHDSFKLNGFTYFPTFIKSCSNRLKFAVFTQSEVKRAILRGQKTSPRLAELIYERIEEGREALKGDTVCPLSDDN